MKKSHFTLILFLSIAFSIKGQYTSFESLDTEASKWHTSTGALSISADCSKYGSKSLKWSWLDGSVITIENPSNIQSVSTNSKGMILLWIYNPMAVNGKLEFQFYNVSSSKTYSFQYSINYVGWRACWVGFNEMDKFSTNNASVTLKIIAPTGVGVGTLYFDKFTFSNSASNIVTMKSAQLPFVNPTENQHNFTGMYLWDLQSHSYTLPASISAAQNSQIETVKNNAYRAAKGNSAPGNVNSTFTKFLLYNIGTNNNFPTGKSIVYNDPIDANNSNDIQLKEVGDLSYELARIAVFYTQYKDSAVHCYKKLMDHLILHGFAVGGGLGNSNIIGYSIRGFSKGLLLMSSFLDAQSYDKYLSTLQWWVGTAQCRQIESPEWLYEGLMDIHYSLTESRLISILLIKAQNERFRYMSEFMDWFNATFQFSPGTLGGLKPDGSTFHHWGLYSGYSQNAFMSLSTIFSYFYGSSYLSLNKSSFDNLANSFINMCNYVNFRPWALSLSGRTPFSYGALTPQAGNLGGWLAIMGNYNQTGSIYQKLAKKFLRFGNNSTLKNLLSAVPIENDPESSFVTMNYGALGLYRSNTMLATLKGYNKYVWSSEIYSSANRYGRYLSYGSIFLTDKNDSLSQSGYVENGWDWNRIPGATYIKLPFSLLESPYSYTLMERSDETFAGSNSLEGTVGMFGVVLQERNLPNFTPSFRAYKSAFCFNGKIVCLGSNIVNDNSTYKTETAIFQNYLPTTISPITIDGNDITSFPYITTIKTSAWISDVQGNYYFVPAQNDLYVSRSLQESRENDTKVTNYGNYATAWIDHGFSPVNGSYNYCIFLKPNASIIQDLISKKTNAELGYDVIQQNEFCHAVKELATNITSYAIFTKNTNPINKEYLYDVDTPCMIMIKPSTDNTSLKLSICSPDLQLQDQSSIEPRLYKGNSKPININVKIKGNWSGDDVIGVNNLDYDPNLDVTSLNIDCVDGIPKEISLKTAVLGENITHISPAIHVFPTITKGKISIIIDHDVMQKYTVFVKNLNGINVGSFNINGTTTIDLSYIVSGVYILQIKGEQTQYSYKVIKI